MTAGSCWLLLLPPLLLRVHAGVYKLCAFGLRPSWNPFQSQSINSKLVRHPEEQTFDSSLQRATAVATEQANHSREFRESQSFQLFLVHKFADYSCLTRSEPSSPLNAHPCVAGF